MGNDISSGSVSPDPSSLSAYFEIICDGKKSQEERRKPFDILRNVYAPNTSHSPSYAEELRKTFERRYPIWPVLSSRIQKQQLSPLVRNCVKGCIFGAALGDAVGVATEFLTRQEIHLNYGSDFEFSPACTVYADAHRLSFASGDWTDDTDQLVLILISLLETGGRALDVNFAAKLTYWKENGFPGLCDTSGGGLGRSTKAVLQSPGFATDPIQAAQMVWERGGRKLAPNGAIMRTAICGIPYFWDVSGGGVGEGLQQQQQEQQQRVPVTLPVVEENTRIMCQVTHADPRCLASCLVVTHIIGRMLWHHQQQYDQQQLNDTTIDLERIIDDAVVRGESVLESPEQIAELHFYTKPNRTHPASVVAAEEKVSLAGKHDGASSAPPPAAVDIPLEVDNRLDLGALQLDEPHSIGYTYKCLACGLTALRKYHAYAQFSVPRENLEINDTIRDNATSQQQQQQQQLPPPPPPPPQPCSSRNYFQEVMCDVVREGGDVGCYAGFSALPEKWLTELPYEVWLDAWVQKLVFMLDASY